MTTEGGETREGKKLENGGLTSALPGEACQSIVSRYREHTTYCMLQDRLSGPFVRIVLRAMLQQATRQLPSQAGIHPLYSLLCLSNYIHITSRACNCPFAPPPSPFQPPIRGRMQPGWVGDTAPPVGDRGGGAAAVGMGGGGRRDASGSWNCQRIDTSEHMTTPIWECLRACVLRRKHLDLAAGTDS